MDQCMSDSHMNTFHKLSKLSLKQDVSMKTSLLHVQNNVHHLTTMWYVSCDETLIHEYQRYRRDWTIPQDLKRTKWNHPADNLQHFKRTPTDIQWIPLDSDTMKLNQVVWYTQHSWVCSFDQTCNTLNDQIWWSRFTLLVIHQQYHKTK